MSFVRRVIEITITLGEGKFGDTPGNRVTLKGHRCQVDIVSNGGLSQGMMQARIYGLPLSMINQLTTIGPIMTQMRSANTIQIDAGNEGETLTTVYIGNINTSWGDFQAVPDVALNVIAYSALDAAIKPYNPTSYSGGVDVSIIMKSLADAMGYSFEDNNVHVIIDNPYYGGTVLDQIKSVSTAAGINFDISNNKLSIWTRFGYRDGAIPTVSPESGLVGYPVFSSQGVMLQTEFMPSIVMGGQVTLKDSQITMANGTWRIYQVSHSISAELPGGPWFTHMTGWNRV